MAHPISAKTTSCPSTPSQVTRSRLSEARRHCGSARKRSAAWSSRPTIASRPTSRTAASVRNFAAPEHQSTADSTARRCSTPAVETSQSMPTSSAARHRIIAYPVIPICRRPIRRTLRTRRSPAISTVASRILRRRATALPWARPTFSTRASSASRSRKTTRFITFPESTAKTTAPGSMRIRRSS